MNVRPDVLITHYTFLDGLKDSFNFVLKYQSQFIITFVIIAVISIALYKAFTKKRK